MANSPGPGISVPWDLSSLRDAPETVKKLRKELKEANKDIEKAKKGTKDQQDAAKKRYQQAQRDLDQYQAKILSSKNRVKEFVDSRVAMQKQGTFLDSALTTQSKIMAAKALATEAVDTYTNYVAPRITNETLGKNSFGQDIDYRYTPSKGYRNAELAQKGGSKLIQAGYELSKVNPEAGAVVAAVGAGVWAVGKATNFNEDYQEGQKYKARQSELGQRAASSEMIDKLHDQYRRENPFSVFDYKKDDFQKERADQDAKIAALDSLRKQRNAAVDMGNFSAARQIMRRAPDIVPGLDSNPVWKNPADLYTSREATREASKSWARNNMTRAGPRTGD